MLDADGFIMSLDQLIVRVSTAPDGEQVHARREPADPTIRMIQRSLQAQARARRLRLTVTVLHADALAVAQDRRSPAFNEVAAAMNQPTGF